MALNKPFGLSPARTLDSNDYNQQVTRYVINVSTSDVSAYNIGDLVKSVANGDGNGVPGMIKAAGTDTVRGVIVGVEIAPPSTPLVSLASANLNLQATGIPATKNSVLYYVYVLDDPNALFICQDDGITTGNLVNTSCNKNFSFTITAGATNTSYSGTVILSSSITTTAGLNGKLVGLQQVPGNTYGAYAIWNVKLNQHELQGNTAGV